MVVNMRLEPVLGVCVVVDDIQWDELNVVKLPLQVGLVRDNILDTEPVLLALSEELAAEDPAQRGITGITTHVVVGAVAVAILGTL